ncbi:MAG: GIY-YIG nuclease family protein [Candidatus Abawacabacteria bacterium]|nr:GIY-YIG nuclease family protein [Candidatus Abawacabacteria bacterium]
MYYIYILQSSKDKKLYIGYSQDYLIRLGQHNEGLVKSTRHRRPFTLLYIEGYQEKKLATKREKSLKQFGAAYKRLTERIHISDSI